MRKPASVLLVLATLSVAGCGGDDEAAVTKTGTTGGVPTSAEEPASNGDFRSCLESAGVTIAESASDLAFAKKEDTGLYGATDIAAVLANGDAAYSIFTSGQGAYRVYVSFPENGGGSIPKAIEDPSTATVVGYLNPDDERAAAQADKCLGAD